MDQTECRPNRATRVFQKVAALTAEEVEQTMKLERFNLVEWATVAAIIVVVGAVLAGGAGFGCAGCRQAFSHVKSVTVGLNRKITVYGMDGKVIQQWTTNTNVEDKGGSFRFMVNGKAVQVAGTVVIEEQ